VSNKINFICIERNVNINSNDNFIVVGWGNKIVNNVKVQSDVLMQVSVPKISTQECYFRFNTLKQICAGDPINGSDSCKAKQI
jgi:hypothetical protein